MNTRVVRANVHLRLRRSGSRIRVLDDAAVILTVASALVDTGAAVVVVRFITVAVDVFAVGTAALVGIRDFVGAAAVETDAAVVDEATALVGIRVFVGAAVEATTAAAECAEAGPRRCPGVGVSGGDADASDESDRRVRRVRVQVREGVRVRAVEWCVMDRLRSIRVEQQQ